MVRTGSILDGRASMNMLLNNVLQCPLGYVYTHACMMGA